MKIESAVRVNRKLLSVVTPWPMDEVSTRNCCHCLAPKDGIHVTCQRGHPMVTTSGKHKRRLAYNGVIRQKRLLKPCQGCKDFDNSWAQVLENGSSTSKPKGSGQKRVKIARNTHHCRKCGVKIKAGDRFTMRLEKERGFFSCYPICLKCSGIECEARYG